MFVRLRRWGPRKLHPQPRRNVLSVARFACFRPECAIAFPPSIFEGVAAYIGRCPLALHCATVPKVLIQNAARVHRLGCTVHEVTRGNPGRVGGGSYSVAEPPPPCEGNACSLRSSFLLLMLLMIVESMHEYATNERRGHATPCY